MNFTWLYRTVDVLRVILDIGIVWFFSFYLLKIFRNNARTIQIIKGIMMVVFVRILAAALELKTLSFILDYLLNWGFLAVVIIFQPEIRSLLERVGKSSVLTSLSVLTVNQRETLINELVGAVVELSASKTGALITLEQGQSLEDFVKTGTPLNSIVTKELLTSIFVTSTPLHDGAVILRGDLIACASAYFPPTNNQLPQRYGARHRAAVGISEITDSVTIVVSEETGSISITHDSKLTPMNENDLREYLKSIVQVGEQANVDPFNLLKRDPVVDIQLKEDNSNISISDVLGQKGDRDE